MEFKETKHEIKALMDIERELLWIKMEMESYLPLVPPPPSDFTFYEEIRTETETSEEELNERIRSNDLC